MPSDNVGLVAMRRTQVRDTGKQKRLNSNHDENLRSNKSFSAQEDDVNVDVPSPNETARQRRTRMGTYLFLV